MSENEQSENQASVVTMALAGCSIIWILAASLLGTFFVAIGTLACGAICDQMSVVWIITGILLLFLVGFCVWLFIAMIKRRISSGLFLTMLAVDISLFGSLIAIGVLLGGYDY